MNSFQFYFKNIYINLGKMIYIPVIPVLRNRDRRSGVQDPALATQ